MEKVLKIKLVKSPIACPKNQRLTVKALADVEREVLINETFKTDADLDPIQYHYYCYLACILLIDYSTTIFSSIVKFNQLVRCTV